MTKVRFGVELGDELGFVPFAEKTKLLRRIESMGGCITPIINEDTSFLISRGVTREEFLGSLPLQHALKCAVPIVTESYLDYCEEHNRKCVTPLDEHVVGIPQEALDEFLSASSYCKLPDGTTISDQSGTDKPDDVLEFSDYDEMAPPSTAPYFQQYDVSRLHVFVLVDCECVLELHHVISRTTDEIQGRDTEYPFRVMLTKGTENSTASHCVKFFRFSHHAESAYAEWHAMHISFASYKCVGSVGSREARRKAEESPLVHANQSKVSTSLQDFAAMLYAEAYSQLGMAAAKKVSSLNLLELSRAEAALIPICSILTDQLRQALRGDAINESSKKELEKYSKVFFSVVPASEQLKELMGKDGYCKSLVELELMEDACRCLRTALSCGEWAKGSIFAAPRFAQYSALGNSINEVTDSIQLQELRTRILKSSVSRDSTDRFNICRAWSLKLEAEQWKYKAEKKSIGNETLLFHGSRMGNWVNILQSGLRVPLISRLRRDQGMLGRGIYFGDDLRTAVMYSSPISAPGPSKVLVLVCSVLLGNVADFTRHQYDLIRPPPGYHSVHGVRSPGKTNTDFSEDEFVIYEAGQQKMEYLLEVEVEAGPSPLPPCSQQLAMPVPMRDLCDASVSMGVTDTLCDEFQDPKVKAQQIGLLGSGGNMVPLKNTRVKAQIVDLIGEVNVYQQYTNDGEKAIEAKYVFPLQGGCAVCGFEAYINDKKIVGKVKEKEEARKEYKAAVERGDGAYLMDESEESPDVFTVSVGNLPPKCDVVIRITYVLELRVNTALGAIEFIIPSNVHPQVRDREEKQMTQSTMGIVIAHGADIGDVQVEVGLDMPFDIEQIQCSHIVDSKHTACRATLRSRNLDMRQDFVLYVRLSIMNVPRIWVEEDPDDHYSKAAMITFFPTVDASKSATADPKEIVFCIDCSASMSSGDAMEDAKQALIMMIKELPSNWCFNIVAFGSFAYYIFPKSVIASSENVGIASGIIRSLCVAMGGTDITGLLRSLGGFLKADIYHQRLIDVVVISDGQIADEHALIAEATSQTNIRIFSITVGSAANHTVMMSLASKGRGVAELLPHSQKRKWRYALTKQIDRTGQAALTNIKVEWSTELSARLREQINATVTQSPQTVSSLFNGESTIVYGIVLHQARQCEVIAERCGADVTQDQYGYWPEQRFLVTVHGMSFRTGNIIHRLAAKARIREWVEGVVDPASCSHNEAKKNATKQAIIDIGCHFGIVTPFTSMIAVEERTDDERKRLTSGVSGQCTTPNIDDVAHDAGSVDTIPEVAWDYELGNEDVWVRSIGQEEKEITTRTDNKIKIKAKHRYHHHDRKKDSSQPDGLAVTLQNATDTVQEESYQTLTELTSKRRRMYFPYIAKYAAKSMKDAEEDRDRRKNKIESTAFESSGLSEMQVEEFREAFHLFDPDFTGTIRTSDLGKLLRALGQNPTESELCEMISELDADLTCTVDFPEFISLMASKMKDTDSEEEIDEDLKDAFAMFAEPGSNGDTIPVSALNEIMCNLGEKLSEKEIKKMVHGASADGGRTISLRALVRSEMADNDDESASSAASSESEADEAAWECEDEFDEVEEEDDDDEGGFDGLFDDSDNDSDDEIQESDDSDNNDRRYRAMPKKSMSVPSPSSTKARKRSSEAFSLSRKKKDMDWNDEDECDNDECVLGAGGMEMFEEVQDESRSKLCIVNEENETLEEEEEEKCMAFEEIPRDVPKRVVAKECEQMARRRLMDHIPVRMDEIAREKKASRASAFSLPTMAGGETSTALPAAAAAAAAAPSAPGGGFSSLEAQIRDTQATVMSNISKVMDRGEKLEDLCARSEDLASSARSFNVRSNRYRNNNNNNNNNNIGSVAGGGFSGSYAAPPPPPPPPEGPSPFGASAPRPLPRPTAPTSVGSQSAQAFGVLTPMGMAKKPPERTSDHEHPFESCGFGARSEGFGAPQPLVPRPLSGGTAHQKSVVSAPGVPVASSPSGDIFKKKQKRKKAAMPHQPPEEPLMMMKGGFGVSAPSSASSSRSNSGTTGGRDPSVSQPGALGFGGGGGHQFGAAPPIPPMFQQQQVRAAHADNLSTATGDDGEMNISDSSPPVSGGFGVREQSSGRFGYSGGPVTCFFENAYPYVLSLRGLPPHLKTLPFENMAAQYIQFSSSMGLCAGCGKVAFNEERDYHCAVIVSSVTLGWKMERDQNCETGIASTLSCLRTSLSYSTGEVQSACRSLSQAALRYNDAQTVQNWCEQWNQVWGLVDGVSLLLIIEMFVQVTEKSDVAMVKSFLMLAAIVPGMLASDRSTDHSHLRELPDIVTAFSGLLAKREPGAVPLDLDVAEIFVNHVYSLLQQFSTHYAPSLNRIFPFAVRTNEQQHGTCLSSYVPGHISERESCARNYYE